MDLNCTCADGEWCAARPCGGQNLLRQVYGGTWHTGSTTATQSHGSSPLTASFAHSDVVGPTGEGVGVWRRHHAVGKGRWRCRLGTATVLYTYTTAT